MRNHAAVVLLALVVAACVDVPVVEPEPQSRLVAAWDPLACGDEPHRVVVELEDDAGVALTRSAPCLLGGLSIDIPHWGIYRGRSYAWLTGPVIRSVAPVQLEIDANVVQWTIDTPR